MITIRIDKSTKCNEEYAMYVSFEYNQKIVDTIRSLATRFWNKDTKEWEVPLKKLQYLLDNLSEFDFDISGKYVSLEKPIAEVPKDFSFKTTPYEHQITGFNYGLQNDRWLLGDEMGLGKTKQVIDIAVAKKLMYGYEHCLIVCGVNGLKWNWFNEILTHSNEKPYILGQRRRKNGNIFIDGAKAKLDDVLNIDELPYFIITNIETMRNQDIVDELITLCKSKTIGMIAFDECHKAKDPNSQQGKGMLKLKAHTQIAMTGTPLMNTPLDLYFILKWLGEEQNSFYKFRNRYCVMGGFNNYQILEYRHLDELQERLNDIMLRRLKDDVLDLPEKTYVDEYVELTSKQAKIYCEVSEEIKENIDKIKCAPNPLAELIRMRQATGYTGILSTTIKESAKLDRMEELVEEAVNSGKKVVVFSNWTQMTTPIAKRLEKYNPAVITGEINADTRQLMVDKFQTDNRCKVIIGTSGAIGTGITLTAGTVEIFLDEPWNMALKEQCVDRCHRIGQKNNLTVYTIIAKNTIDERVHDIVLSKGELSDAIVDGVIKQNKEQILDFLLS
jgi:SNF2 family DNA or RNA helicase